MIKCPKDKFKVGKGFGTIKNCGDYDSKTTFWDDKCEIEAVYYYWKGELNYLSSWGFDEGSAYQSRKVKAKKANKPFFSFLDGWYGYEVKLIMSNIQKSQLDYSLYENCNERKPNFNVISIKY